MTSIDPEIYAAILTALESRLHLIGSVVEGEARREAMAQKIFDRGDFHQAISYLVDRDAQGFVLRVGSRVPHEPFVLGGKIPSWTPIAPLIGWVERKHLAWTDKRSGAALSVEQMAYMIQHAIHARGIPARNVFQTVLDNREQWIYDQLNSIEVSL